MIRNALSLKLSYIVCFCYLVLGNAATFNFGQRLPIKLAEILSLPLILDYLLNQKLYFSRVKNKLPRLFLLWCALDVFSVLINLLIWDYSFGDVGYGLFYLFRIIHIFLVAHIIVITFKFYNVSLVKLRRLFVFCFLITCIIGIVQYFLFPVVADWYEVFYKLGVYWPTPDPHKNRIVSTYMDPNYYASILIVPILLNISLLIFDKNKFESKRRLLLELIILLITLLMTKSRSGIVGLGVGLFIMILCIGIRKKIKPKYYILFIIFVTLCIYLVFFSNITVFERIRSFQSDDSAAHRFDSWIESWEYIKDNPIIGVGYNMFGAYQEKIGMELNTTIGYGVDSSFLLLLITTGFIGGLLFLYVMFKIIKAKNNFMTISIKAIFIGSFAMSFFNNLLFNVLWLFPFLLILFVSKNAYEMEICNEKNIIFSRTKS